MTYLNPQHRTCLRKEVFQSQRLMTFLNPFLSRIAHFLIPFSQEIAHFLIPFSQELYIIPAIGHIFNPQELVLVLLYLRDMY